MKRPPCAWNIPSLATGSSLLLFFFSCLPLQPTYLATRIEAAKWHWRAHWACRLTLAHPGMRLVEDHPTAGLLSMGCLGQFMTPSRGDCTVDTLESKWLSRWPAPWLPAPIQGVILNCLFGQQISLLSILMRLPCCITFIASCILHTYHTLTTWQYDMTTCTVYEWLYVTYSIKVYRGPFTSIYFTHHLYTVQST